MINSISIKMVTNILIIFQATGKGKKEQEKLNALVEKLQDERRRQVEHVEKVMARLKKVSVFKYSTSRKELLHSVTLFRVAGERLLVFVSLCQVSQERDHHPVPAAVFVPPLHLYRTRCRLLCQVRANHTQPKDSQLLHSAMLRQGEYCYLKVQQHQKHVTSCIRFTLTVSS